MSKQSTALTKPMSDEVAEQLKSAFPQEASALRIRLPRFNMISQDVTEEVKNPKTGKKEISIITEAGTFVTESQSEELDEDGKKKWDVTELGVSIPEITILYERKQLRFYDQSTKSYTSSPIYDTADEVVPLWRDKKEVARGTPAELRARPEFQGKTADGKSTSKLEEDRVLFVKYEGQAYQWTVRGSSKYAWLKYKKDTVPNHVITSLSSEAMENGATKWNQTTFSVVRRLNAEESEEVLVEVQKIQRAISMEKESYANVQASKEAGDKELEQYNAPEEKSVSKKGKQF
jgi:hypothetical protein